MKKSNKTLQNYTETLKEKKEDCQIFYDFAKVWFFFERKLKVQKKNGHKISQKPKYKKLCLFLEDFQNKLNFDAV